MSFTTGELTTRYNQIDAVMSQVITRRGLRTADNTLMLVRQVQGTLEKIGLEIDEKQSALFRQLCQQVNALYVDVRNNVSEQSSIKDAFSNEVSKRKLDY